MTNPQAGWYPDPSGDTSKIRYWNGTQWTDDYADAQPSAGQTATATATGFEAQQPCGRQPGRHVRTADREQHDVLTASCAGVGDVGQRPHAQAGGVRVLHLRSGGMVLGHHPAGMDGPHDVHAWGIYKGTKDNTTAFGVCTLIFLSLVAGILLLVSKKDR